MIWLPIGWFGLWSPLGHGSHPFASIPLHWSQLQAQYTRWRACNIQRGFWFTLQPMRGFLCWPQTNSRGSGLCRISLSQVLISYMENIHSDLVSRVPALVVQPFLLSFFQSTYSQPSSQSTSPFSLYIPEAHSLKCKGCLNTYENLHGHALRASNLYVKTQLFTAKRQQQIKMSPHLPWADWGHQRQEELTGPWEWWPQSRSTCIVAPHLPYRGWPHSTQSSQIHNKTKNHLTLHHIIQYLLLSRKSPLCV